MKTPQKNGFFSMLKIIIVVFTFLIPSAVNATTCNCFKANLSGEGGGTYYKTNCPDADCKQGDCKYDQCAPDTVPVTEIKDYEAVQAQEAATTDDSSSSDAPLTWTPNITIGSFTQGQAETISGDRNILGEYISIWYKFLVGIAGLLATIMIIMGGVTWLTSGGSSAIIGDAKKTISSALIGLTLALLSYILLQVINPNLTTMKMPSLTNIEFSGDYKMMPAEFQSTTGNNANSSNNVDNIEIQPASDAQSFADSMARVYSSQIHLELTENDINNYREYADDFYNLSVQPEIYNNSGVIVYPTNITEEILSENIDEAYKIFDYYNLSWDKYDMKLISSNNQSWGGNTYNALIFIPKKP